mmetsp:Transcript_31301/g.82942  ORF Transcript_31301/g.82942 Transcript_31301/m.82942 type:complete len:143 (+) Transcript_31301:29-457(+)
MLSAAARPRSWAALGFLVLLLDGRGVRGPAALAAAQAAGSGLEEWVEPPTTTVRAEVPLNLQYPGLLKCNPADTKGCIERCSRSAPGLASKTLTMCALIRCLSDCTALVEGPCAASGRAACELVLERMNHHEQWCQITCGPR